MSEVLPPERVRSGRFVLRLPPATHRLLAAAAREHGLSLNEYCVRRLEAGGPAPLREDAPGLVARAAEVAGDALIGVVLYGSCVRGDAGPDSDLDAILAVERDFPVTRELYARWDSHSALPGPPVDPHFSYLPERLAPSNRWGEAAMEGVVLFERGRRVTEVLRRIRQAAAEGLLVRRVLHGQPYWSEAESLAQ